MIAAFDPDELSAAHINRHRVSRTRRTSMPLRIRVHDNEPIGLALRRFKKLLDRSGIRQEIRERSCHVPPTHVRGTKKFLKRLKARLATLEAQKAGEQPCASLEDAAKNLRKRTGRK